MEVRFYLDPDSGEPHVLNHGISETEVIRILSHANEDLPAANGARMAIGENGSGACARDLRT